MALILYLETSTKNCSVSIAKDNEVLITTELNNQGYSHAEKLHPFILDSLEKSNLSLQDIDAVAVSKGPGSYTGLRIGVSAAKGLAYALEKPLISINTLKSLSFLNRENCSFIIPVLDARRMEVYSSIFDSNHKVLREIQAEIIDKNSYAKYLEKGKVCFVGDAVSKIKEVIDHSNAIYLENTFPTAKTMHFEGMEKYIAKNFEDIAYFEPYYLKDFVVLSKKKK